MQIVSFLQQPPLTNCDHTRKEHDKEALFSLAYQEYTVLKAVFDEGELDINNAIARSNALFCFCEKYITDDSLPLDTKFSFEYTDPNSKRKIAIKEAPICEVYYSYMTGFGYLLEMLYNYAIVIASYVFRSIFIYIAEKVRFLNLTNETRFVMMAVFHITFLNYGII